MYVFVLCVCVVYSHAHMCTNPRNLEVYYAEIMQIYEFYILNKYI